MNKELLFDMLSTPSVSGCEIGLQKKVYSYMKDKADLDVVLLRATGREDLLNAKIDIVDNSGDLELMDIPASQFSKTKFGFKKFCKWFFFKVLNRINLFSSYLIRNSKTKCFNV